MISKQSQVAVDSSIRPGLQAPLCRSTIDNDIRRGCGLLSTCCYHGSYQELDSAEGLAMFNIQTYLYKFSLVRFIESEFFSLVTLTCRLLYCYIASLCGFVFFLICNHIFISVVLISYEYKLLSFTPSSSRRVLSKTNRLLP